MVKREARAHKARHPHLIPLRQVLIGCGPLMFPLASSRDQAEGLTQGADRGVLELHECLERPFGDDLHVCNG